MSKKGTQKKGKRQLMRERREQQARRQRLITVLIVVGVALVLVALIAVPAIQSATEPVGEFVEITPKSFPEEDGLFLGDPNAPVKIEVFEDFKCSACKGYSEQIEPLVISELVEPGTVYYAFRQYPFMDDQARVKDSDNSANASMCAADQNRFWDFKTMLYANLNFEANEFNDKRMVAFAESLDLDMKSFNQCYEDRAMQSAIDEDIALGGEFEVSGTPSVYVNGVQIKPGYVPSFEEISQAVDAALNQ